MDLELNARLNRAAIDTRDNFLRARSQESVDPDYWQVLKHRHPYFGFAEIDFGTGAFLMFSANDDQVVWEYFWTGAYERRVVNELARILKDADVFLDIGAYTGCMALMACTINKRCSVHCFEPMPRTLERLIINVKVNRLTDRIIAHQVAASDTNKLVEIYLTRRPDFLSSGNSLKPKEGIPVVATELIRTVRIDDHVKLAHGQRVSCVKIDVEGHELEALLGMERTLRAHRPEIIVEVWPKQAPDVFGFFAELRYERRQVQGLNWLFWPI